MPNPIISPSISPNTEPDDVVIAIKTLFSPWTWKSGSSITQVEDWFREKFKTDHVYSFSSGRTALYGLLTAFDIGKGDEVIVQAFTCVAVPEVVMWVGAQPVYVDIDDSYNIDPKDLEKKITKKTRAIIVQHTFGIPAKIREIREIGKKHTIIVIEDCAHSLGATVDGKLVGTFGDGAIFSFGRDKVVSSVFGGVGIINQVIKGSSDQKNSVLQLKKFHKSLEYPSFLWIKRQLLHPILFNLIVLPFYNVLSIGKIILVLFQKMKLLSFPVEKCEYRAEMPKGFLMKYPNGLARLAMNQLNKLEKYNLKRRQIAERYRKGLTLKGQTLQNVVGAIYLRYPLQLQSRNIIVRMAKKKGVLLGNWYHCVIDPFGVQLSDVGYRKGSCSHAERLAEGIVNLPTYPRMTEEDVIRTIRSLKFLIPNF